MLIQKSAVLLLSGGLDSAANLALTKIETSEIDLRLTLTINYGQGSAQKEEEHAALLSRHFGVKHITFDFRNFASLIGLQSALFGREEIPNPTSLDDLSIISETAKSVWVPNRNGVLLSIASAVAESRGLDAVLVGFNAEEAVTFPDNSTAYMDVFSQGLRFSTQSHVQVLGLTSHLNKIEIIQKLAGLNFPFELLWSCYRSEKKHCGKCESCQRLKRALVQGYENNSSSERNKVLEKVFGSCNL